MKNSVELAGKIRARRESAGWSKRATFMAADVAPATYERIEGGEPVREASLHSVLSLLWPGSDGDVARLDEIEAAIPRLPLRPSDVAELAPGETAQRTFVIGTTKARPDIESFSDLELIAELTRRLGAK